MNNRIRVFLERLTDRITALTASIVGTTFTTFRAAQQAQQQSFLEDLARNYEAEDKPHLAENLRQQAAALNMDDPATDARSVLENLLSDQQHLRGIEHNDRLSNVSTSSLDELPQPKSPRKRRRSDTRPSDDRDVSLD